MINREELHLGNVDIDFSRIFSCIYCIYNNIDGKIYLGVTVGRLSKRFRHHLWELRKNRHSNGYLQRAFNLHGESSFGFGYIECDIKDEDLNDKEIFYIKKFKSTDRSIGYNLLEGGKRKIHSAESCEKISKSNKARYADPLYVNPLLGRKATPEALLNMSKAQKGLKKGACPEDRKLKISLANKGKIRTKEQKERMSASRKGKYNNVTNKNTKKVILMDDMGNELRLFFGTEEAGDYFGYCRAFIADICRGKRKSSKGLILKYA